MNFRKNKVLDALLITSIMPKSETAHLKLKRRNKMKKILSVSIMAAALFIIGCASAALLNAPVITYVMMDSTSVEVRWARDTLIEGHEDGLGYNVYVYTDSTALLVEDGENLNKYNPEVIPFPIHMLATVSYTIYGLSQDTIYYIQVRTVNIDEKVGGYNANVPFIMASPRPEYTATVTFEMNSPGVDDSCAIRFSDATIMADSAMVSGNADMWVDYWGLIPDDSVAFDSPSHSTEWGSGARVSKLLNLGQYDLDDITEVTTEPTITTYVPVNIGDLIIVKTADDNYVKVHVDTIDILNYKVTITYAYQNIADFPYFSP